MYEVNDMAILHEQPCLAEDGAHAAVEGVRWPGNPICSHCARGNGTRFAGQSTRPDVLECRNCGTRSTVSVSPILHRPAVPLCGWGIDFRLMRSGGTCPIDDPTVGAV